MKIQINRRDFLKGMMALAGAVVLTELPILDWVTAETTSVGEGKPVGRLGSIRLREKWYSLQDADIKRSLQRMPVIWEPSPERFGQYDRVGGGELLTNEWAIDVWMGRDGMAFEPFDTSLLDFEIDSFHRSFSGWGYVSEYGIEGVVIGDADAEINVFYALHLEGVESLAMS